jgi:Ca2+/Na+ antiporter
VALACAVFFGAGLLIASACMGIMVTTSMTDIITAKANFTYLCYILFPSVFPLLISLLLWQQNGCRRAVPGVWNCSA